MELNGKTIDLATLEIGGVDPRDYPDFCDAYFEYAQFEDGTPLTEEEMQQLDEQEAATLNEMAYESLI